MHDRVGHSLSLATLKLLLAITAAASLGGCYSLKQAYYQNNLFNSRRLVSEVLEDSSTDTATRAGLERLNLVLAYAQKAGLRSAGAYRYYIAMNQPVVSFLVEAAEPLRLESITWWFPLIGNVPYLGYFNRDDRDAKALELRALGDDVFETGVGAYSSLGWFDDPIYTPMLHRSDAEFAHLIFHELTHRTLWVRGSVEFNENLAEYVADQLQEQFLRDSNKAEDLKTVANLKRDRSTFKNWLVQLKAALTANYQSTSSPAQMTAEKSRIFANALHDRWPKFLTNEYEGLQKRDWNNAMVLGYSLYSPDVERFAKAHRCLGAVSLSEFLTSLERATASFDDGFAALDSLCTKTSA